MIGKTALAALLLFINAIALAGADSDIVIKLDVIESRYCLEADGGISLRAMLGLTYENTGRKPIILARPTRVSGYGLFPVVNSESAARPEAEVRFRKEHVFDASKMETSRPNPKLFEMLEPGATLRRVQELLIFVSGPTQSGRSLLGKEYSLQVEVDHWPDKRASGEKLRDLWKDYGVLWMEPVRSRPIELRIQKEPAAKHCVGRVD